jgi:thiamine pyrophosphokinase
MAKPLRVAIVLHGDYGDSEDILTWTSEADYVVAADGAADILLELGITPDKVIGDMDGIRADTIQELPPDSVIAEDDQNTTDFQKALAFVRESFAGASILVLNFEGSQLDHVLSTLFSAETGMRFVGKHAVCHVLGAGDHRLNSQPNARLSLLPLPKVVISRTEGLAYDASRLTLEVGGRDGVSNEATAGEILVSIASGILLAFVQRFEGEQRW